MGVPPAANGCSEASHLALQVSWPFGLAFSHLRAPLARRKSHICVEATYVPDDLIKSARGEGILEEFNSGQPRECSTTKLMSCPRYHLALALCCIAVGSVAGSDDRGQVACDHSSKTDE